MQGTSMYHLYSEMVQGVHADICRGEVSTCVEVCIEVKCVSVCRGGVHVCRGEVSTCVEVKCPHV